MSDDVHKQEFEYVARKLGITIAELQNLFEIPKKTFRDYKNKRQLIIIGANFLRRIGLEKRYFRNSS